MKIAVASDGLDVATHFARCTNFNHYATTSYEIADCRNMPAVEFDVGELARMLDVVGVDVLICGSIEEAERRLFTERGITVVSGASGDALESARAYLADNPPEEDDGDDEATDESA